MDDLTRIAKSATKATAKKDTNALPLNREQLISYLNCINIAVKSNGKLLVVFWDKDEQKIIDFSGRQTDKTVYTPFHKEDFLEKLKANKIEFKLVKKEFFKQSNISKLPTQTKGDDDDELVIADIYTKNYHLAEGRDGMLIGTLELCTQLLWYEKIAAPGVILIDSFPDVESSSTFLFGSHFVQFNEGVAGFDYNQSKKIIEGYVGGSISTNIEYYGLKAGRTYPVKAHMTASKTNKVTYDAQVSLW